MRAGRVSARTTRPRSASCAAPPTSSRPARSRSRAASVCSPSRSVHPVGRDFPRGAVAERGAGAPASAGRPEQRRHPPGSRARRGRGHARASGGAAAAPEFRFTSSRWSFIRDPRVTSFPDEQTRRPGRRGRGWPMHCRTSRISCSGCRPGARRSRSTTSCARVTVSRNLDWSAATTFNLDEFVGIGPEDPGTYRRFMQEHLFRHINLRPERINFLDGERGSRRGVRALRADDRRGGRHRPADSRHRHQRPYRLQRAGARPGGAHPSRHADDRRPGAAMRRCSAAIPNRCRPKRLSMGMATILQARTLILLAHGEREGAVRRRGRPRPAHDRAAGVVPAAAPRRRHDRSTRPRPGSWRAPGAAVP